MLLLSPFALIFLFIILSSLITPILKHFNLSNYYEVFNFLNSKICHQYSPRSLFFFENNIGLCARCFAFYTTAFLYILFLFFIDIKVKNSLKIYMFFLFVSPLVIDGITQLFQLRESNFLLRTITGAMAGIGVSVILFPIYLDFFHSKKKEEDYAN